MGGVSQWVRPREQDKRPDSSPKKCTKANRLVSKTVPRPASKSPAQRKREPRTSPAPKSTSRAGRRKPVPKMSDEHGFKKGERIEARYHRNDKWYAATFKG